MTGIVVLTVLALALITALESSNRRHGARLAKGPDGSWSTDDRDLARSKLDLLALGAAAEPLAHKPVADPTTVVTIRRARLLSHSHGRHAA